MATKTKTEAQNPLLLRCHRLMEAFGKSDDERDFYLDRMEGFIIYLDLDKNQHDLDALDTEITKNSDRYCMIPKLTFYETKKIMEGFVNEKVYDIDTKEKLLDIIQSKEARENFLEFIYDHHSELEKWQQYYQERSRIRIIEWLRNNHFHFVFEEDLELSKSMMEKLKRSLFQSKVGKDIQTARKVLFAKAKTYYSNEALNPRPKRGRPPKQAAKTEIEPQVATDIYTTVPASLQQFLFIPDISSAGSVTFSSKFENEEELLASRKIHTHAEPPPHLTLENINQKLASLRSLSSRWIETDTQVKGIGQKPGSAKAVVEEDDEEDLDSDEIDEDVPPSNLNGRKIPKAKTPVKKAPKVPPKRSIMPKKPPAKKPPTSGKKPPAPPKKGAVKRIMPKITKRHPKMVVSKKSVPAKSKAAKTNPKALTKAKTPQTKNVAKQKSAPLKKPLAKPKAKSKAIGKR